MTHSRDAFNDELERLFCEHSQQLFTGALAVTGCPERAEDAVQEAFYRLFRMERRPRHLKAYVFRSVRNAAVDQVEKYPVGSIEGDEGIFDPGAGPGETASRNEFMRKVARAMKTLTENERETVISHLYADLNFREIARVRDASINTVWSWYRRGMEKLRKKLGEES